MKNIFFILTLVITFLSCDTEVKNESQTGIIQGGDAKSLVMNAFNDAYLANDMTGQEAIFTDDAVANVNGQEMSPSEMMISDAVAVVSLYYHMYIDTQWGKIISERGLSF